MAYLVSLGNLPGSCKYLFPVRSRLVWIFGLEDILRLLLGQLQYYSTYL